MFGIDCCDAITVKMKSRYYLKFSIKYNVFIIEIPKSVFVIEFESRHFSSSLSSFKANFCSVRNMLDKFHTSLARVTKIMGSWLKETYIVSSYIRGYGII